MFLSYKKKFVTKFVTSITKLVTCVSKFVTSVTKFVIKIICAESKKMSGRKEEILRRKEKIAPCACYALSPFCPFPYRIIAKFMRVKVCGIRKILNFA